MITPTVVLFLIILGGLLIGKIKIYSITLDLSAVLILAVLVGYVISVFAPHLFDTTFEISMRSFSKLGTALFISVIGLSTGSTVAKGIDKKGPLCFFLGMGIVCVGIVTMRVIGHFDAEIDRSLLAGILCGAMTSTPGLSAVCETVGMASDLAVLGYGCSYLFGVMGVVLFVQLAVKKGAHTFKETVKPQQKKACDLPVKVECLIPIGLSVVLGSMIGNLKMPGLNFSLGTSGGILCAAIVVGILMKRSFGDMDDKHILCYRNLGLVLFFVGSGVPAGQGLAASFDIKWFGYGVILTVLPIFVGYILSHIVWKGSVKRAVCVIAGGMTSTPAMAVLLRNSEVDPELSAYSFAYIGSLSTMVIFAPFL